MSFHPTSTAANAEQHASSTHDEHGNLLANYEGADDEVLLNPPTHNAETQSIQQQQSQSQTGMQSTQPRTEGKDNDPDAYERNISGEERARMQASNIAPPPGFQQLNSTVSSTSHQPQHDDDDTHMAAGINQEFPTTMNNATSQAPLTELQRLRANLRQSEIQNEHFLREMSQLQQQLQEVRQKSQHMDSVSAQLQLQTNTNSQQATRLRNISNIIAPTQSGQLRREVDSHLTRTQQRPLAPAFNQSIQQSSGNPHPLHPTPFQSTTSTFAQGTNDSSIKRRRIVTLADRINENASPQFDQQQINMQPTSTTTRESTRELMLNRGQHAQANTPFFPVQIDPQFNYLLQYHKPQERIPLITPSRGLKRNHSPINQQTPIEFDPLVLTNMIPSSLGGRNTNSTLNQDATSTAYQSDMVQQLDQQAEQFVHSLSTPRQAANNQFQSNRQQGGSQVHSRASYSSVLQYPPDESPPAVGGRRNNQSGGPPPPPPDRGGGSDDYGDDDQGDGSHPSSYSHGHSNSMRDRYSDHGSQSSGHSMSSSSNFSYDRVKPIPGTKIEQYVHNISKPFQLWYHDFARYLNLTRAHTSQMSALLINNLTDRAAIDDIQRIPLVNGTEDGYRIQFAKQVYRAHYLFRITLLEQAAIRQQCQNMEKDVGESINPFLFRFNTEADKNVSMTPEQRENFKIETLIGTLEEDIQHKYNEITMHKRPTNFSEVQSIVVSLYSTRNIVERDRVIVESIVKRRALERVQQSLPNSNVLSDTSRTVSYNGTTLQPNNPFVTPPTPPAFLNQYMSRVLAVEAGMQQSTTSDSNKNNKNNNNNKKNADGKQQNNKQQQQGNPMKQDQPASQQHKESNYKGKKFDPNYRDPRTVGSSTSNPSNNNNNNNQQQSNDQKGGSHLASTSKSDNKNALPFQGTGPCGDCKSKHHSTEYCSRNPQSIFHNPSATKYFQSGNPLPEKYDKPYRKTKAEFSQEQKAKQEGGVHMLRNSKTMDSQSITVNIMLHNTKHIPDAFIDSGSSHNMISKELYHELHVSSDRPTLQRDGDKYHIETACGAELKIIGTVTLGVVFRDETNNSNHFAPLHFLVADQLSVPIILGYPTLTDVISTIDFNKRIVQFQEEKSPLSSKPTKLTHHCILATTSHMTSHGLVHTVNRTIISPHTTQRVLVELPQQFIDNHANEDIEINKVDIFNKNDFLMRMKIEPYIRHGTYAMKHSRNHILTITNEGDKPLYLAPHRNIAVVQPHVTFLNSFDGQQLTTHGSTVIAQELKLEEHESQTTVVPTSNLNTSPPRENNNEDGYDINPFLDTHTYNVILSVLRQYKKVFEEPTADSIDEDHHIEHQINVGNASPIKQAPYRTSPDNHAIIAEEVNRLLAAGMIRKSSSPWASPVILVPKPPPSKKRMCVDMRRVNDVVEKDAYPLRRIDDSLEELGNDSSGLMSLMDLKDAYHHVRIAKSSIPYTAFVTREGLYEWLVMTFGHCNAPATFQRYMDNILHHLKKSVIVYFDDILVHTKNDTNTHASALSDTLKTLNHHKLHCKKSKCHFGYKKVKFLAHIVENGTISPDPDKVKGVSQFPVPQSVLNVKSFTALCNYYRRFVPDFAKIARPLYQLTKKNAEWKWSDECQHAFDSLKQALLHPRCLYAPDFSKPFILQTDASQDGFGAVLTQIINGEEHPIGFASTQTTPGQRNYCATDLEVAAVVWGILQFEHYLMDKQFTLITDHSAIQFMKNKVSKSKLTNRSFQFLSNFNFEVQHREGIKHVNADALSRNPVINTNIDALSKGGAIYTIIGEAFNGHPPNNRVKNKVNKFFRPLFVSPQQKHITTFESSNERFGITRVAQRKPHNKMNQSNTSPTTATTAPPHDSSAHYIDFMVEDMAERDALIEAQKTDTDCKPYYDFIVKKEISAVLPLPDRQRLVRDSLKYCVNPWDNGLYFVGGTINDRPNTPWLSGIRLVIPLSHRNNILELFHSSPFGGHMGITRTQKKINANYWWKTLWQDTCEYVKGCIHCKTEKVNRKAALQPKLAIEPPNAPFHTVSMDYIGPLPQSEDFRYCLVSIDHFTSWTIVVPVLNADASTTAMVFHNEIVCKFGAPSVVLTDQGRHFTSPILTKLWTHYGIDKRQTTAYHPQCNGKVERRNDFVKQTLHISCETHPSKWANALSAAVFAINTSINEFTGLTPYFALFGREARLPTSPLTQSQIEGAGEDPLAEYVNSLIKTEVSIRQLIRHAYSEQSESNFNQRMNISRIHTYKEGDLVLVSRIPGRKVGWTDTSHVDNVTTLATKKSLLKPYNGPYIVVVRSGTVTYGIRALNHPYSKVDYIHASRLKPFNNVTTQHDSSHSSEADEKQTITSPTTITSAPSSNNSSPTLDKPIESTVINDQEEEEEKKQPPSVSISTQQKQDEATEERRLERVANQAAQGELQRKRKRPKMTAVRDFIAPTSTASNTPIDGITIIDESVSDAKRHHSDQLTQPTRQSSRHSDYRPSYAPVPSGGGQEYLKRYSQPVRKA